MLSMNHLSIGDANNGALVRVLPTLSGLLAGVRLTSVGDEVVAVGPRHRLDIPGAQSECRESLQTVHLSPILPNFILLAHTPHFSLFSTVFWAMLCPAGLPPFRPPPRT